MDAHALLTAQGWRGAGHSLHPTSDETGLSRPLLVSKKQNNLGVGKKQHRTSDMWWMNAFDTSLKGLDTSKEGIVVQTVNSGGLDMAARGGSRFVGSRGLYASFVRGESLSGTITLEATKVLSPALPPTELRTQNAGTAETEERRARKAARRAARTASSPVQVSADRAEDEVIDNAEIEAETREQQRERRKRKKLLRLEKAMSMERRLPSKRAIKKEKRRAE